MWKLLLLWNMYEIVVICCRWCGRKLLLVFLWCVVNVCLVIVVLLSVVGRFFRWWMLLILGIVLMLKMRIGVISYRMVFLCMLLEVKNCLRCISVFCWICCMCLCVSFILLVSFLSVVGLMWFRLKWCLIMCWCLLDSCDSYVCVSVLSLWCCILVLGDWFWLLGSRLSRLFVGLRLSGVLSDVVCLLSVRILVIFLVVLLVR